MLKKYSTIKQDIFEYVQNRIQAGAKPEVIAQEIKNRYRAEIAFFKCKDPEMIDEFMQWLAEFAFYFTNRMFYDQNNDVDV